MAEKKRRKQEYDKNLPGRLKADTEQTLTPQELLQENIKRNARWGQVRGDVDLEPLSKVHAFMELVKEAQATVDEEGWNRQELLDKLLAEASHDLICGTFLKNDGAICMGAPVIREDGTTNGRCRRHGGGSTGPVWKREEESLLERMHPTARLVLQVNVDRFQFNKEERELYVHTMNEYIEKYELDTVNIILLDRAMRNWFMNARGERAEMHEEVRESSAVQDFDTKALRFFQALGFDRKFNKSQSNADNTQKVDLAALFMEVPKGEPKEVIDMSKED